MQQCSVLPLWGYARENREYSHLMWLLENIVWEVILAHKQKIMPQIGLRRSPFAPLLSGMTTVLPLGERNHLGCLTHQPFCLEMGSHALGASSMPNLTVINSALYQSSWVNLAVSAGTMATLLLLVGQSMDNTEKKTFLMTQHLVCINTHHWYMLTPLTTYHCSCFSTPVTAWAHTQGFFYLWAAIVCGWSSDAEH